MTVTLEEQKSTGLTLMEIMFATVVAVALGVSFWGWTFVYELTKPFLKIFGLKYLLTGVWILSAVLPAFIIRKPGIAIIASVVASLVEGMISSWGIIACLWGLVQGVGAELVFLFFFYRKWNFLILCLAASVSALFSYTLDYFYYNYNSLSLYLNMTQLLSFIFSAILLSGVLTLILSKKLLKTGLLQSFKISQIK